MIKSLIFDFGGTIDTNGTHWIEMFWNVYKRHSINISKDQFVDAYIFAERRMNYKVKMKDSFRATLINQLSLQFEYLQQKNLWHSNNADINSIAGDCYTDVEKNITQFRKIINELKDQFSFAVVSNFYGNLETVLDEFDIRIFFKVITDSTLVKIRKPDPGIFFIALKALFVLPEESFVIGDSYENDIIPAKEIGCGTVWLINKTYDRKDNQLNSDYKISSIEQIQSIFKIKHKLQ